MEKYLPIIYVRGYAGSQGAVESTVDKPYYGFNLGSTQVRTGPDGDPDFFIFESPLVRLIRDHGYTDLFARIDRDGAVELLNGEDACMTPAGSQPGPSGFTATTTGPRSVPATAQGISSKPWEKTWAVCWIMSWNRPVPPGSTWWPTPWAGSSAGP